MSRTMRQLFADVQTELELALAPGAWEVYIHPLKPVSFEGGVLTLAAPNGYVQEVCLVRLDKVIRRELAARAGRTIETRYVVEEARNAQRD